MNQKAREESNQKRMRRMRATLVESGIEDGSMMSHDEASELLAVRRCTP